MLKPSHNEMVPLSLKKNFVTFEWTAPYPEFDYILQLFSNKTDKKPFKAYKLKKNSLTLPIDIKKKEIWWNVLAVSKYKNINRSNDKFKFTISPQKDNKYLIGAQFLYNMSNYTHKLDSSELSDLNTTTSLSGPSVNLSLEFTPAKWKQDYNFVSEFQTNILASSSNKLTTTELNIEMGKRIKSTALSEQRVYLGLQYIQSTFEIMDLLSGNDTTPFFNSRYQYRKRINRSFSIESNAQLLIAAQTEFIAPSYKLKQLLNYQTSKNKYFSMIFEYRNRNVTVPYRFNELNGQLSISVQDLAMGIGFFYEL